ncbi:hypothetical protein, partial [Romboutsia sp.]|uniref:hypothetical protein n=1 Tax=Romboutsia sp. TaxID=1965302 RepID=UPI003F2B3FDB
FKATSRVFLPLYITLLVVALINGLSVNADMFKIQGLIAMIFGALIISLFVITIVVIVQRFSKNLLGDEGYLMFTLPVSNGSILVSKYLAALLWTVLSGFVAFVAFCLIIFIPFFLEGGFDFATWFDAVGELFRLVPVGIYLPSVLNVVLLMFLTYSIFIFTVYLSLSMGQLPVFSKHRNLASFISFIGINVVFSFIENFFAMMYFSNRTQQILESDLITGITTLINDGMLVSTLFNLVLLIGLFFGTKFILDKKLNLE